MYAAAFQVNRKFYISGGEGSTGYKISDFFSINSFGQSVALQPMKSQRSGCSLSGRAALLVALGGFNRHILAICEQY